MGNIKDRSFYRIPSIDFGRHGICGISLYRISDTNYRGNCITDSQCSEIRNKQEGSGLWSAAFFVIMKQNITSG